MSHKEWNRLSDASIRVIYLAQQEAKRVRTSVVDTEHLLIGLMREPHASIAYLLERYNITLDLVCADSARYATLWNHLFAWGRLTLSVAGKRALNLAIDIANGLNAEYGFGDCIESDHILLGLLEGYAAYPNHATDIVRRLGVDPLALAATARESFIKRKNW